MRDSMSLIDIASAVLDSLVEQVAIIDRAGMVTQVNDAWKRCAESGREAVDRICVGDNLLAVLGAAAASDHDAADALAGVEQVLQGSLDCFERESARTDHTGTHWFRERVAPLKTERRGAVVARFDITYRKRAEQEREAHRYELGRAVRAATLGQLSGALAHELNQPLTAILANAQVGVAAIGDLGVGEELGGILRDIVDDARRAGDVIQRLRSLLQRHEAKLEILDLNRIAENALMLSRSELLVRQVHMIKSYAPDPLLVDGDAIELQHLLLNVIVNACEAMSDTPPRERRLEVSTFSADDGRARVLISDSGAGIETAAREKMFQPFYTTKQKGLGLGLSICRSIVAQHGGDITITNRAAGGAEVLIEFPRARRPSG